jgi:hypothetical protein
MRTAHGRDIEIQILEIIARGIIASSARLAAMSSARRKYARAAKPRVGL